MGPQRYNHLNMGLTIDYVEGLTALKLASSSESFTKKDTDTDLPTSENSFVEKDFGQLVLLGFMSPLYTCSLSTS